MITLIFATSANVLMILFSYWFLILPLLLIVKCVPYFCRTSQKQSCSLLNCSTTEMIASIIIILCIIIIMCSLISLKLHIIIHFMSKILYGATVLYFQLKRESSLKIEVSQMM